MHFCTSQPFRLDMRLEGTCRLMRETATCVLSRGITEESVRGRGLGMDVSHRRHITTGLRDSHQSNVGTSVMRTLDMFSPRTKMKRTVFYQILLEVYEISSQSAPGNLFSHAGKIRNYLKERPARV